MDAQQGSDMVNSSSNADEASQIQMEIKAEAAVEMTGSQSEVIQEAENGEPDFLDDLLKKEENEGEKIKHDNSNEVKASEELQEFESETDSSDSESDADSESEDSDDVEEEQVGDEQDVGEISDNEADSNGPILSKNEVGDEKAEQLPEGFTIDEKDPIQIIGEVSGFVDNSIIIKSNTSGEFRFLKEGSVLCFEDRTPLGYLFEIFGPVSRPLYRVKFNHEEQMQKFKDLKNYQVFYLVPKSNFEYTDKVKAVKGSDASNCNDEEVPEDEQEFSDDEKEMEFKQQKKQAKKNSGNKKRKKDHDKTEETRQPKKQLGPSWNSNNTKALGNQSFSYQSRSQREHKSNRYPSAPMMPAPPAFYPPPPMMMPMPTFPMTPMAPGQQPMNPAQIQQYYQFQQMMMMQQFMHQNSNQGNQQQPPPPPPPSSLGN